MIKRDRIYLSSSEIISCKECGQHFDTIDALREHEKSEQEDKELQNKGLPLKLALRRNFYKIGNKVQDEACMQYW
jgi:hypothetical protein